MVAINWLISQIITLSIVIDLIDKPPLQMRDIHTHIHAGRFTPVIKTDELSHFHCYSILVFYFYLSA